MSDWRAINLANWNSRVPFHERGYGLERFGDPAHLSDVVRFDLPRLGDISGLDGVHLQCHIGTDTLSLARLGARMSGLDFSAPALDVARRLAATHGQTIDYVRSDVYDAVAALGGARFDLVYTGIGAIGWLPDIEAWARVVAGLLRPGGRLFLREGHPMLCALCDPRPDELLLVEFPYFTTEQGIPFVGLKTYVDHEGELSSPGTIEWNHGLGEVVMALMGADMQLERLDEHRSVPWRALGSAMVELPNGEFELRDKPERLAASYTIVARKRG